jgi:hypothetical protein
VTEHYLAACAHNEHFLEYRQIVRDQIESQLTAYLAQGAEKPYEPPAKPQRSEAEVAEKVA